MLTSFRQRNWSVDEWYNDVQALVSLAKYLLETASILHWGIFWFFLKDEEFVSKTINDSNIDLETIPASKVRQVAKKMESSKSTVRHIKQVASDPQAAQVNLMRHQRTDLQLSKSRQKQYSHKSVSKNQKRYSSEHKNQGPPYQKKIDPSQAHQRRDKCSKCGDYKHIGFKCTARKSQCKSCSKYGHFTSFCYKRQELLNQETPRHISLKQEWSMQEKIPYVASQVIWPPAINHSAYKLKYNSH